MAKKRKTPKQLAKALAPKEIHEPNPEGPEAELRDLMKQHVALTRRRVGILHSFGLKDDGSFYNRKAQKDQPGRGIKVGDEIPCEVPGVARTSAYNLVLDCDAELRKLEQRIGAALKGSELWKVLLSKVFGCGELTAAYLIYMIDFTVCTKVSQLQQFCGIAVDHRHGTGRLARPVKGEKLPYCTELRTRLWQTFNLGMWMHSAGIDSKYLRIWRDTMNRLQHSERVNLAKNEWVPFGKDKWQKGAKAFIRATGWHKAADVFIEDVYIVGRTLAGLPVWPSYYAAKLGYEHGGKICVNEPRLLTIDQALEMVGDVGSKPLAEAAE